MPLNTVVLRLGKDGVRGEPGAVVRNDHAWSAAAADQIGRFTSDTLAGNRGVRDHSQAFPRHVIDDVRYPEAPTAGKLIMEKIPRSARVWPRLD